MICYAAEAGFGAASSQEQEVIDQLSDFVRNKFDGHIADAYNAYAHPETHQIGPQELNQLLTDANIGGFFRGMYVQAIMQRVDTNGDGMISWKELLALLDQGSDSNS
jgi:hypothetical protein